MRMASARTGPMPARGDEHGPRCFRLPLSAICDAQIVVVLGDEPVSDRAPIVDMWIKLARGTAEIVTVGPGTGMPARRAAEASAQRRAERKDREASAPILVWSGAGGHGGATLARARAPARPGGKDGSGAFHLPAAPNARGVAGRVGVRGGRDRTEPAAHQAPASFPATRPPPTRRPQALAEHAESVLAIAMLRPARPRLGRPRPARDELPRARRHVRQPRGPGPGLRRAVIPPGPDELAWLAKLAERFDVELSPYPAQVFEEI